MTNDYAMSVKARSLFSKHLTQEQFRTLSAMQDVQSVASYLKNETRYGEVLSVINEREIHREALEKQVRHLAYEEFLSLMRYVRRGKTDFFRFYTKRNEIEQILYRLHSIFSNVPYQVDAYIERLSDLMVLDMKKLSKCTTLDQLITVLNATEYKDVFKGFEMTDDISRYEDALNEYYRVYVRALISKENNAKLIQSLFDMDDELQTIEHVYRLKKFYHVPPEDILPRIRYHPYLIEKRMMKRWIQEFDADGFLAAFETSSYGRYVSDISFNRIESYLNAIRYRIMKHNLRYSSNSNVTLVAYMNLLKYEINNVIDVIEGVRYEMSPDEIMDLLTK